MPLRGPLQITPSSSAKIVSIASEIPVALLAGLDPDQLADAVERAHSSAKPGEMVLFSPGTSSFDMFKSYADRGDQFRALVRALPET